MNWDALGAVGEIAGAVGVIVTLAYLAKQVRQNSRSLDRANEHAQATSVAQMTGQFNDLFASISDEPQFAAIYHRAMRGGLSDPVESVQFTAWVNRFLAWTELNLVQHRLSLGFEDHTEESAADTLRPFVASLIAVAVVRQWWEEEGRTLYSTEMIKFVDNLIAAHEPGSREGPP